MCEHARAHTYSVAQARKQGKNLHYEVFAWFMISMVAGATVYVWACVCLRIRSSTSHHAYHKQSKIS